METTTSPTTATKPPVGSLVLYRGEQYVIDRYPTHNLDTLDWLAMAVKLGNRRATRINWTETTAL